MASRLLFAALLCIVETRQIGVTTVATTAKDPEVSLVGTTTEPNDAFTILGERKTTVKFHHATQEDEKEWILIQQGNWSIRIPIVVENTGETIFPEMASGPSEWSVKKSITVDFPDDEEDGIAMDEPKTEEKRDELPEFHDESLWGPVANPESVRRFWSVQHFRDELLNESPGTAEPPPPEDIKQHPKKIGSDENKSKEMETTDVEGEKSAKSGKKLPEKVLPAARRRFRPSLWSMPERAFRVSAWSLPDQFYQRIKRYVGL